MKAPLPFQAPSSIPVIGQPFQLTMVRCLVDATLSCNCGGESTTVEIRGSVGAPCPSCGRVFNMAFNPTTNKMEVSIAVPKVEPIS